jgi:ArsR family transcriptional regulator
MAVLPMITARCCPPVMQAKLKRADAAQLAAAFKVIADPARLRLLSLIAAQPSGEACVCNLTRPLGLSQPTVSHHLKVMHGAGLLERERRGTWVFYRIVPEALATLRDALQVAPGPQPD